MPLISLVILMVVLLFESLPNATSEITFYADREFYQDWWNACTMDDFFRKWHRLTYQFLYYHVYKELLEMKVGRRVANTVTMLASGLMHEAILVRLFCLS